MARVARLMGNPDTSPAPTVANRPHCRGEWSLTQARTGRELQRYSTVSPAASVTTSEGTTDANPDTLDEHRVRLCCGCVPLVRGEDGQEKVLLVSSRKKAWTLPKGGWEADETSEEAALRETFEEAGVAGELLRDGEVLCEIDYMSCKKSQRCRVRFYALRVTEVLERWPEQAQRSRCVVSLDEARRRLAKPWMRQALDAVEALQREAVKSGVGA